MSISTIKALIPSPSVLQPMLRNTQVALFSNPDHFHERLSHMEHKAGRFHHGSDLYGMLQEGYPKVGGIVDIYI